MKNIAKPAFLGIPMPLIPLNEQERIAEILSAIASKVSIMLDRQTHYQTLKRGLMQKLLTGEWRIKLEDAEPVAA
jgi:type I restriction enzyme S subunit